RRLDCLAGGGLPEREWPNTMRSTLTGVWTWLLSWQVAVVCRLTLGAIFIVAGLSKVGQPLGLYRSVLDFQILPEFLAQPFALTLPWVEIICGSLVIAGLLLPSASALLSLVNVAFLIAIGVSLSRGTEVACGCFGTPEELSWAIFARDVGFLLLSLQILAAKTGPLGLDRVWTALRQRAKSGDYLTGAE
ncbi:MAG: MauE/DoxX family redox-associated membrane protein, partial [Dehalococcoidia bacterium]|nr:MauE/DoxX family redox-associated membrane protein [Dehalococcoidia bacterium]